jgi:hypothetical protein
MVIMVLVVCVCMCMHVFPGGGGVQGSKKEGGGLQIADE